MTRSNARHFFGPFSLSTRRAFTRCLTYKMSFHVLLHDVSGLSQMWI
jgi:hypothetical protein